MPGRWCSHGWPAWTRLITDLGLDARHLRLQVTHNTGMGNLGATATDTSRLFTEKSASSVAIVGLLSKWCSGNPKFGMKSEIDRQGCLSALTSLVELAFANRAAETVDFFQGADEHWEPPRPPSGTFLVRLTFEGCFVDMSPLLRNAEAVHAFGLNDRTTRRSLVEVLQTACGDLQCARFAKQIVWYIGSVVDDFWAKKLAVSEVVTVGGTPSQVEKQLFRHGLSHSHASRLGNHRKAIHREKLEFGTTSLENGERQLTGTAMVLSFELCVCV